MHGGQDSYYYELFVLNENQIYHCLDRWGTPCPWCGAGGFGGGAGFAMAGAAAAPVMAPMAPMTTTPPRRVPAPVPTVAEAKIAPPQLRTMFPETWIWVDQIAG